MSYNNNWAKELKETFSAINKDSEQLDEMFGFGKKKKKETPKPKANKPAKPAKPAEPVKPVKPAESPLDANAMDYALGLGGTRHEHVEHEGNNLQEEMALNEDLLMLIDVLCEELGIDVEELMEATAFTDAERRENPDILGMERHQLGRLRNLADRVNRGMARLNNPGNVARDRLAKIMRAKGADVHAWDGKVRGASEYRGNHEVITPKSRISTGHTDEKGRMAAAGAANLARTRDRRIANAQLARRKSDEKWGAPEGID